MADDKPNQTSDAPCDRAVAVKISQPDIVGRGFNVYERYAVSVSRPDDEPLQINRDVLRVGRVAAVLAIDIERQQVILIRQFRLAAHLATGMGEMVEIVAGRVEQGESAEEAAHRECAEEIGVAPGKLFELMTFMPAVGAIEEHVTLFLAFVDAMTIPLRAGLKDEDEDIRPICVEMDAALAALASGNVVNGLTVVALQWLALNRSRLHRIKAGSI